MSAKLAFVPHTSIAPAIPSWIWADGEESDMRVPNEKMRHCSVFLGWPSQTGFAVDGTGFLVTFDYSFAYLLSAAHILWPGRRRGDAPHAKIFIRINRENGPPSIIETTAEEWVYHEDKSIDLCAYPFDVKKHSPNDELEISRIDLASMAISDENIRNGTIGLGDEVIIIGAFTGRIGYKNNIPIIRVGNIAAMPEEPVDFASPRYPAYLIETRSLGGISGSPVFANVVEMTRAGRWREAPTPPRKDGRPPISTPYNLIGMIIGAHGGPYFSDFVSETDTDVGSADFEFNAGISVAIPMSTIMGFLLSAPLREPRDAAIEQLRRQSGYRPTSASSRANSASEGNPNHKEDFTSLLNAAAKTKPQGD